MGWFGWRKNRRLWPQVRYFPTLWDMAQVKGRRDLVSITHFATRATMNVELASNRSGCCRRPAQGQP